MSIFVGFVRKMIFQWQYLNLLLFSTNSLTALHIYVYTIKLFGTSINYISFQLQHLSRLTFLFLENNLNYIITWFFVPNYVYVRSFDVVMNPISYWRIIGSSATKPVYPAGYFLAWKITINADRLKKKRQMNHVLCSTAAI